MTSDVKIALRAPESAFGIYLFTTRWRSSISRCLDSSSSEPESAGIETLPLKRTGVLGAREENCFRDLVTGTGDSLSESSAPFLFTSVSAVAEAAANPFFSRRSSFCMSFSNSVIFLRIFWEDPAIRKLFLGFITVPANRLKGTGEEDDRSPILLSPSGKAMGESLTLLA